MRAVQHQLLQLLSPEEVTDLHVHDVFASFGALNPLHHSPYAKLPWEAALTEYRKLMAPVEREVARKPHARLASSARCNAQSTMQCTM